MQGIRLYKEAGLTAAGTADHNNVQIPLVLVGIIAEAEFWERMISCHGSLRLR